MSATPKQLTMLTSGQIFAFNSDGEQIGAIQMEFATSYEPIDRESLRNYANEADEFHIMDWWTKQCIPLDKGAIHQTFLLTK